MFLVAILSTFSAIHGLEDGNSTRNFVAFFTILWWTWMQTVMFDVRFGVDSIYDRVCKGITWCVTIAFMLGGAVSIPGLCFCYPSLTFPAVGYHKDPGE